MVRSTLAAGVAGPAAQARLCGLLRRGAERSIATLEQDAAAREDFARGCIYALLECSVLAPPSAGTTAGPESVGAAAIGLVDSLAAGLAAFVADAAARDSPKKVREALFTVRTAAALVTREHALLAARMYPALVGLVGCACDQLRQPLRDALALYVTLLPH